MQASVQVDGQQSRWFRVEEGLRQGYPLSSLLYSIYIMGMVEELERERLGVKVSGVWCGALLYADDIVLRAETGEELQKMLDMVGRYAEKNSSEKWRIGDEEMEEVKSFKYLGAWFDQRMRGNVRLEKMVEQVEEWAGKIDGKGGWGTRGRVRSFVMGPSGKARPGTCSRGVVAWAEDSRKVVGGCTG